MKKYTICMLLAVVLLLGTAGTAGAARISEDDGKEARRYQNMIGTYSGMTGAITEDGSLWIWPLSPDEALSIEKNVPGLVNDDLDAIRYKVMENVKAVTFSSDGVMVLKDDNALWIIDRAYHWDGGLIYEKIDDNVVAIDGDNGVTAYVKSDGSVWVTGRLFAAELPDIVDSETPVKLLDGAIDVSVSGGSIYIIKTDYTLWAMGWNEYGYLGDGTRKDRRTPVKILDDVVYISKGPNDAHRAAIKKDGSLWAWGNNWEGQVGNGKGGESAVEASPVKIMDNVIAVSTSHRSSAAIKEDGSLWIWGDNSSGQFGNGTRTEWKDGVMIEANNSYVPIKVMDNVIAVSTGETTMAVKEDGTLWVCGNNRSDAGAGTDYLLLYWILNPVHVLDNVIIETPITEEPPPSVTVPAEEVTVPPTVTGPAEEVTAPPTVSTVFINGESTSFDAYIINNNNYFKLRDLAYALSGTNKQFEIGYDGDTKAITLTSGKPYTSVGGEMAQGDGTVKTAAPTASKIYLDGEELSLTVYSINDNNFFKLRDLMTALDVYVGYDDTSKAITVDTGKGYVNE